MPDTLDISCLFSIDQGCPVATDREIMPMLAAGGYRMLVENTRVRSLQLRDVISRSRATMRSHFCEVEMERMAVGTGGRFLSGSTAARYHPAHCFNIFDDTGRLRPPRVRATGAVTGVSPE